MSSLLSGPLGPSPVGELGMAPPPHISVPGAGGGDGPDNASVAASLKKAEQALQSALSGEKDAADRAVISQLIAKIHGIEAGRQKEADSAMGIGAGQKMIRRYHGQ